MKMTTIIKSRGALALAVFFAVVTARTIFDDVWAGASVTIGHLNAAAALVAAIASGHLIWPSLKQAKIASSVGLCIIFVAATGYIVISSGARNAEVAQAKVATIAKANDERAAAKAKLAEAEADLADAKLTEKSAADAAARECGSGKKSKCDGRIATRDNAARNVEKGQSHAALMRVRLDMIGPEHELNGGYKHAAKVLAALPWISARADEIETRLELLMPFATTVVSEIGALVFGGLAIGHRTLPTSVPANDVVPGIPPNDLPGKRGEPTPRKPGRRGRRADQRVIDFSEAFSRKHGRTPSGSEIKTQFPTIPTSTAYDYAGRSRMSQVCTAS